MPQSPEKPEDKNDPPEVEQPTGSVEPTRSAVEIRALQQSIVRRRRLTNIGVVALSCVVAYYVLTSDANTANHLFVGIGILFFAILPAILWARKQTNTLPVFEIFMLTGINTYAIPLLNAHVQLQKYDSETITAAAWAVLLYQVALIGTYSMVKGKANTSPFFTKMILNRKIAPYIGYGLWITTIYIYLEAFTSLIPFELISVLRAVVYGIGMACVFIAAYEWGKGNVHPRDRTILVFNIIVQFTLQIAGLVMIGGIALVVLAMIGYVSGSKKIPIIPLLILIPLLAVLHNGKAAMRAKYWDERGARKTALEISNLPAYFSEWLDEGLKKPDASAREKHEQEIAAKLLERSSLFHMLCLVVAYSPERLPYLEGETYFDIPGQFIPRIFWPEKPRGHVSTYRLATYYGIQRMDDTAKTTVGFGILPEAYANFGYFGAMLLGVVMGFLYKKIHILTTNSPLISNGGLLLIVLMAWSYQTEMTMSIWISSMFQALVAVIGVPFALRRLFN